MLQLGSLIVLCGLLSGTSALLSGNIASALNNLELVKINELNILDVKPSPFPEENAIVLELPVRANVSVLLPLLGSALDVAVSLDIINSLAVQTDAQSGLPTLSIGQCTSDTDNISISLLGRRSALLNRLLDEVSGRLTVVVSNLLENQLCPLLQSLLSNVDVKLLQDLLWSDLWAPALRLRPSRCLTQSPPCGKPSRFPPSGGYYANRTLEAKVGDEEAESQEDTDKDAADESL
ncbi:BPI fold-containing family A member 2-like [Microtus pennsylvanicus]|uniref:BPI fold-containing family A member 2-like n=1 Tax=Microtus pennsylvanicus TaxID=10058 RepID=UPI003F6D23BD